MNGRAVQLALREVRAHLGDLRILGSLVVAGILLGVAGPFGTFESLAPLPRIAFWLATAVLTYMVGYSVSMLADAAWGEGRPLWLRFILMVLPSGFCASVIVGILNLIAFGPSWFGGDAIPVLLAQCYAVAAGVVLVIIIADRPRAGAPEAPPQPPAILERVPLPQRGRLIALIVEDHYVDIVTERGKTLVLMRLADAMRETGDVQGLQIHRSHWVARDAVVKAHRADGKVTLELSNGMRLPVSRGFLPAVREAGLA